MAFIGNTNTTQAFTPAVDFFSGNGSTTAFTLSRPVASVAQVQVTIDNVAQNPSSAYTVSANTLTFTSAPLSGTNNVYVYYTSPITQVIAPGQGTVTTTSLAGGTVTTTADASINGLTVGKGAGTGVERTVVGNASLGFNTTGANPTAVGSQAMYSNTTGSNNSAFGRASLLLNTTGSSNTAIGQDTLYNNTTASNNTAVGYQAGYSNTTNINFAGFVYRAGYSSTADDNTCIGMEAGYSTTGGQNTFIGNGAGYSITTGARNTILGRYGGNSGGLDIRTASNRVVLADGAGNPRLYYDNNGAIQSTSAVGNGTLYPAFFCRVWVQFNGTGTISITGSGNVTSLSDFGTGDYGINFTNAMPDTSYCAVGAAIKGSGAPSAVNSGVVSMSENIYTTGCGIAVISASQGAIDRAAVFVAVFR